MNQKWKWAIASLAFAGAACGREGDCVRCDTLVIAATGEPDALLPPLVFESVGRDVSDLLYERLAVLAGGESPLDSSSFRPGLANNWDRVDARTLRFHLRTSARWHDGAPVLASDVVFSFEAYADSALDSQARSVLAGRVTATAADDSTVLVRFAEPEPEQWYDATWHVRVLPKHIWNSIPRSAWAESADSARLVGSGPYRFSARVPAQSLTLERVSEGPGVPVIRRVVWRFTGDQDAALNLLLSHEADLLESIGDSARIAGVSADSSFTTVAYPSAVYGFLGFNLGAAQGGPARELVVRRALAMATDRPTAARAALGPGAVAPPGPMSRILWIMDSSLAALPFDTTDAGRLFDGAGWRRGADGMRWRAGVLLALDILVPASSIARRNLAQIVQEMWRQAGVKASVTSVDFPVFQERLRTGRFDTFVGSWLDEPSPRSLGDQWTTAGIGILNYTGYKSRAFDSLFRRAATFQGDLPLARQAWKEAIAQLNADVPGIWLYTPMNTAAVTRRLGTVTIDPYSWLSRLPEWALSPDR